MRAILLVSHGSRSPKTKEEIAALIDVLGGRIKDVIFGFAFLEIESPSIPEGIDQCAAKGALQITILLNFLNSGRHVNNDIPAIVQEAQKKYPAIQFNITGPVGQHPQIADLFVDLINTPIK